MHKIGKKTVVLTEYRYAEVSDGAVPTYAYTNCALPPLKYTDRPVPVNLTGGGSLFFGEPETVKQYRYVYTVVESDVEEEVLLSTISHTCYKIWFNGVYVGANTAFDLFTFFLPLKHGKNLLVMEISPAEIRHYDFNNRMILRSVEEQRSDSFLRDSCLEYPKRVQVFHSPDARGGTLSFVYVPRSRAFVDHGVLHLVDDFDRSVLDCSVVPGQEYRFSTGELLSLSPETKRVRLFLDIVFRDGSVVKRKQYALLREFREEVPRLVDRWESLKEKADPYTVAFVRNRYEKRLVTPLSGSPAEGADLLELRRLLDGVERGDPPYYRTERNSYFYYRSAIDLSSRRIRIEKPDDLISHPGLLIFTNFAGNETGIKASALLDKRSDVIIADLCMAGFSVGCPVSEAILLESIEEIKKLYAIDERRIYLYGYCSNAYAVWSFARNYPHKVAGLACVEALPAATGTGNFDCTKTVSYYWKETNSSILRSLAKHPSNKIFRIRNSSHAFMQFYMFNADNYRFLDHSLPEYPDTVRFYVDRMRHNRNFWITVNEIRRGKTAARGTATVIDEENIDIRLIDCDDISLEIPPKMNPSFTLKINGVSLPIRQNDKKKIRLKKNSSWEIAAETDGTLSRKGTGLLDVYYGPMRILHDGSSVAEEVAACFSVPEAMSYQPKLQVKYPVYTAETFPEEERFSHLILVNTDTVCGKKIDFAIKTSGDGYRYRKKTVPGDYCVLQVVPNPFNPECSILQIQSNRLEKFAKHLLLRKVVLPSMLTGISPYWNCEGVILTDGEVLPIREW